MRSRGEKFIFEYQIPYRAYKNILYRLPRFEERVKDVLLEFLSNTRSGRHACKLWKCFNTLRPRQDGRHFADDIFTCIFVNGNCCILVKFSLKYGRNGPIDDNRALVQIMAWRRSGDKPLSEPMMISLPTHICVTRPQWVNTLRFEKITADYTVKWKWWIVVFWFEFHWNVCPTDNNSTLVQVIAHHQQPLLLEIHVDIWRLQWHHNERGGGRLKSPASRLFTSVCSGGDQRKRQSYESLAFVRGIHRPVISGLPTQRASNDIMTSQRRTNVIKVTIEWFFSINVVNVCEIQVRCST